jgi:hypothetical protein
MQLRQALRIVEGLFAHDVIAERPRDGGGVVFAGGVFAPHFGIEPANERPPRLLLRRVVPGRMGRGRGLGVEADIGWPKHPPDRGQYAGHGRPDGGVASRGQVPNASSAVRFFDMRDPWPR